MENANKFGLSQEVADKMKDFLPTYDVTKIQEGDVVIFQILEKEPREIVAGKDEETGEPLKRHVINVREVKTEMDFTLWLSATSLKMGMLKLYNKKKNNLKDTKMKLSVRTYKHTKYSGDTRAYIVQEDEQ